MNKEALKNAKLSDAELASLGLRIDQGEAFFVGSKAQDADRISAKTDGTETHIAA